jgi:exosortase A-associated hydrolase 2
MFLRGGRGRIFCLLVEPPAAACRGRALFAPAFAEEMNKCRRQMALQARALAEAGFAALVVDPYGTGDSEGEFAEARWETWVEDLLLAARWLEERAPGGLALIGVRAGALLAADLLERLPDTAVQLVLWQPVISGRQHMDQFLRLRVAASMLGAADGTTVKSLRNELEQGRTLEVAGYELDPQLVKAIDQCDLMRLPAAPPRSVEWLEVARDTERGVGMAAQRVVAAWQAAGTPVRSSVVAGDSFWSTVEITVAPALVEHTTRAIAGG